MSTPQKAFLNRWAVDHGADDFNGLFFRSAISGAQGIQGAQTLPLPSATESRQARESVHLRSGNRQDDVQGQAGGRAKDAGRAGSSTNTLTGEVTEVPYSSYTSKESGEPIADDSGAPISAADDQKSPVSAQAPSLAAVNAKIAAGNTSSKKLNKGKPVSSNAPEWWRTQHR